MNCKPHPVTAFHLICTNHGACSQECGQPSDSNKYANSATNEGTATCNNLSQQHPTCPISGVQIQMGFAAKLLASLGALLQMPQSLHT